MRGQSGRVLSDSCGRKAAFSGCDGPLTTGQIKIQALYTTHRTTRNAQQREKFLSPDFKGLIIDPVLLRLEKPDIEPGFKDERHCLVFWARPPEHILKLAAHLQSLLLKTAPSKCLRLATNLIEPSADVVSRLPPDLWLMPLHRMHMTTLEIAHSKTADEIAGLVSQLSDIIPTLTSLPSIRRARVVKPMISYDLSAVAVSFVPAAGEKVLSPPPAQPAPKTVQHAGLLVGSVEESDRYTYHHLRRDAFDIAAGTGTPIGSRYVVPSAHITLARYLTDKDHKTPEQRQRWVQAIEDINRWLEQEVWDVEDGEFIGEWIVGQERGLDCRCGALWYGGGRTIMVGEGF